MRFYYQTYYFAMGSTTEKLGSDSRQGARDVSRSVHTSSWPHPAPYQVTTVGLSFGAKVIRE
jgi:hypothetical protein